MSQNGHNFLGDYNYYVMPYGVFEVIKERIPFDIGVYCPDESWKTLFCAKKAMRRNRSRPVSEILLMMFRSAARDFRKERRRT